ncbi:MAG: hypothetical protein WA667_17405 [Candidatus Nitrosopolaris sp.]
MSFFIRPPVKVNPAHEPSSPDPESSLSQNSEGQGQEDVSSIESMKDPEGPKTREEQGPNGQESLSIEDAKGPEELKDPKVPIAPATSTPAATVTASSTSIPSSSSPSPSPVPEALPQLAGVNSYPYLYPHFNLGYINPQISKVNMVSILKFSD